MIDVSLKSFVHIKVQIDQRIPHFMKTRSNPKKPKLLLEEKTNSTDTPPDLSDLEVEQDSHLNLFDYFSAKDGNKIIHQWFLKLQKDRLCSLCEILSVILQISGIKIGITNGHIESDSYDLVLEEFQTKSQKMKFDPPLLHFLKEKSGSKLQNFWNEVSHAIISSNVIKDAAFSQFREWLSIFNNCKIRIIRYSSTYCLISLFEVLLSSLKQRKADLEKIMTQKDEEEKLHKNSEKVNSASKIQLFENDIQIFHNVLSNLYQLSLILRIRDIDEHIRILAIKTLANAVQVFPSEFCDEQKMKYIGRSLNDPSQQNRLETLLLIQRIIQNVDWNKSENNEQLSEFFDQYLPRIYEMCKDKSNEVVVEAINCLTLLLDQNIEDENESQIINLLISDESEKIRKSAAKFIIKKKFADAEFDLDKLLEFLELFDEDDLNDVVSSLIPDLKVLQDLEQLCNKMVVESADDKSRLLSKLLLLCSKNMMEMYENKNMTKTADYEKKVRKISDILINNLPNLIKAYKHDDQTLFNLIETANFVNLDVIFDCSLDKLFNKLLGEIRDVFLSFNNKKICTTAISILYKLSQGSNQFNEYAKKELNRLAVETSNQIVNSHESISKFVAASRLVDVSDNGRVRKILFQKFQNLIQKQHSAKNFENNKHIKDLHQISKNSRNFENDHIYLESDNINTESDEIDESGEIEESGDFDWEEEVVDYIECLHWIFNWDMKKIHYELESNSIEKDETKEVFGEYLTLFENFLENENQKIRKVAFSAFSNLVAFSPFIFENFQTLHQNSLNHFFEVFHFTTQKQELIKSIFVPFKVGSIDLKYTANLFVYINDETLQNTLKEFWKEICSSLSYSKRPISGDQIYFAFKNAKIVENSKLKSTSRFFIGKFSVFEFIRDWIEDDEDENLIPVVLTFIYDIRKEEAEDIQNKISERFNEIIDNIIHGQKPTQKMIKTILIDQKTPHKSHTQYHTHARNSFLQPDIVSENEDYESNTVEEDSLHHEEIKDEEIIYISSPSSGSEFENERELNEEEADNHEFILEEPDESFLTYH
ncbi:hypothetical protein TRFO_13253 [Tritrichomonas foetus]|uniref:SCD domain-containing protein n=1 Tax=Tritrichomonas foetus TaxID=1144522 RepID=A0A1J4KYR5_9EUKA|nr:hypothetical protein TRFO_13253 [Tritrichomonas foetus]|eukprot:OHT16391.1 hypothetical protein TRFO_13253 [Tritrichomonas foetus]